MENLLNTGIHVISNELYHSDPCVVPSLSRSVLKTLIEKTPAHARLMHPRLNPDLVSEDKAAFDIGTAAHSLFLEGIDCCEIIDFPDWKTKASQEARLCARAEGKTPLLASQWDGINKMVEVAHTQLAASELGITDLHGMGKSELTYIWKEGNAYCRVRLDWISNNIFANNRKLILDFKTSSRGVDPSDFMRGAIDHGYDIQHGFYSRGVQKIEGGELPIFVFMAQETTAPYACSFIGFDPATIEMGRSKTEYGIHMWQRCMETDSWPGYPTRICYPDTPAWAIAEWESIAENIT